TDFSGCDLSAAVFGDCKLVGTTFDQTILVKSDFRTAQGFEIDPENNRVREAKFSKDGLIGLLGKYSLDIS
ncbi:MAG: fluoroquinolone resistance protein, partial [Flavobacteriales bacterium]